MTSSRISLLALAAAIGIGTAAYAQTPIRDVTAPDGISITGTVTGVFGNKFVLEDDSGKVLVEGGPDGQRKLDIQMGEKLAVTGRPDRGSFEAFTITRADGSRIELRPAGPLPPHLMGRPGDRDRGPGRADRGEHGPRPAPMGEGRSRAELLDIIRAAGYTDIDDVDRKRGHYEVEARNRYGEKVEVHIDFAGNIYREKRD